MRVPILLLLTLLLSCCVHLGSALFLPLLKGLKKGYGYGGYGHGGYGHGGYGYGGYGQGGYGYGGYGYGSGYGYGAGYGYGHSPYRQGYYGHRHHSGHRTGRTYSDIARVINPDPYIGGGRFLPRAPFAPLGR